MVGILIPFPLFLLFYCQQCDACKGGNRILCCHIVYMHWHAFVGGYANADSIGGNGQQGGEACTHGIKMGGQSRRLRHDVHGNLPDAHAFCCQFVYYNVQ